MYRVGATENRVEGQKGSLSSNRVGTKDLLSFLWLVRLVL